MTLIEVAVAGGCGLPKNRALRARLKPHLESDPELLAALLIHLELARDQQTLPTERPSSPDQRPEPRRSGQRQD